MAKHLQLILTVTAVVLSAVTFILDLSRIGEDLNNFWSNFSISRLLTILSIIFLTGLLLGAVLFYKKKYADRIKLTIPLAFIFFSTYELSNIANFYFGLSEEYNYFSANKDLKNGKVQLLSVGVSLSMDSEEVIKVKDSIRNQFGFKVITVGINTKGVERYNAVVDDYLTKRNGKNWKKKFLKKIDSVGNTHKE